MKESEETASSAKNAETVFNVLSCIIAAICGTFGYMWANDLGVYAGIKMEWWMAGIIPVLLSSPCMLAAKYYEIKYKALRELASETREEEFQIEMKELDKEKAYLERKRLREEKLEHERALRDIRTGLRSNYTLICSFAHLLPCDQRPAQAETVN